METRQLLIIVICLLLSIAALVATVLASDSNDDGLQEIPAQMADIGSSDPQ